MLTKISSEWKELRQTACPVCGRKDRCKARSDGAITCFRIRDEAVGDYIRVSVNDACCVFLPNALHVEQQGAQRNGHTRRVSTMTRKTTSDAKHVEGKQVGPPDLAAEWESHRLRTDIGFITTLAHELGVSRESLCDCYCVNAGNIVDPVPTFPERDADGRIVGLVQRGNDGVKRCGKGQRRGLTIPKGFAESTGEIFIVEGASDTAALLTMKLRAVGRPSVNGGCELLAELLKNDNAEVIVVGENDRKPDGSWPGKTEAKRFTQALANRLGRSAQFILPPPDAKDVRALLISRRDPAVARAELLAMPREIIEPEQADAPEANDAKAPSGRVRMRKGSDVKAEKTEWLWRDRIPLGKVSLLAGDPGVGKSFVTLDLAARVSRGRAWPDARDAEQPAGDVLILNCEDGVGDTLIPRLKAADADLSRVWIVDGVGDRVDGETRPLLLEQDASKLADAIRDNPAVRLIIIDPVSGYFGSERDSYRDNEVRAVLGPLVTIAEAHNVAIVLVAHLSKPGKSASASSIYRVLGSMGFVGISRAVWAVVRDNRDEADPDARLLVRVKSNLAADPGALSFRIVGGPDGPSVHWDDGRVDVSADEAMGPPKLDGDSRRGGTLREACEWLRNRLGNGAAKRKTVVDEAEAAGFSPRTVDRAASELGLRLVRREWVLPDTLLESVA